MRFLHSGIGFTIALCGLTITNLTAIASPFPPATLAQSPNHRSIASADGNLTLIKGNGVEFTLPEGFKGGSPSSTDTKAFTAEAAKLFPSMASLMQVFDSDPAFLRAIAVNTSKAQNPDIVLITRLPVPANISLKYLQEVMSKTMPSILPPEFKLVNNKILTVGSRQIVKLIIDADIQGAKIKESIGLFKEGDEIFQVTYVHSSENSSQAISVFEQIIGTFKATSKSPVKTPPI